MSRYLNINSSWYLDCDRYKAHYHFLIASITDSVPSFLALKGPNISSWGSTASGEREMSTFPWAHGWDFVDTHHTPTSGYAKWETKMILGELMTCVGSLATQVPTDSSNYHRCQALPRFILSCLLEPWCWTLPGGPFCFSQITGIFHHQHSFLSLKYNHI